MIDQRFMDDLAKDFVLPTEQPVEDTMLAAGPVTSDVPQTGVRLGRAGVTPQQSAKAGGLDKPLIALLDTLAGALRGATGATIGLPGDIRSIVDMINQEGAEAVMGKRMFPTSEEVLQSNILPPVIPAGAPNAAERQKTVDIAQGVGEFLPAPGLLDVPKVVKGATKAVQATKGMPVGMSTQMVGEGVSELGFYSAAKEAVNSIQQPKGTGEQFLKQIEKTPGVKPEEIKWTGLDDFLKSKKSVTKVEVQEFLDKNRVEVKEVQLGEPTHEWQGNFLVINKTAVAKIDEAADGSYVLRDNINEKTIPLKSNRLDKAVAEAEDIYGVRGMVTPYEDKPKFSKYTLPGGENYREILITLPSKNPEFDPKDIGRLNELSNKSRTSAEDVEYKSLAQRYDASLRGETTPEFKSQHFDQPNILAHLRVNDRVDADGKKVLFVEEVQSDWHQAGRKQGYASATKPYEVFDPKDGRPIATFATEKEAKAYADELGPQVDYAKSEGVPDAPFKTTWHELSMKRAIQLAAEGGYDRVAFTTGKTQAERYDLSKQIQDITIKRDQSVFTIQATDKNGKLAIYKTVPDLRNLDEYVGKDLAEKVKDDFANKSGNEHSYDGLDLQVGGEGMKGFYDQILPKFLDKYAKKWDAKTGMTNIPTSNVNIENQIIFENGKYLVDSGDGINYNSYATKVDAIKALAGDNPSVQYIDVTPKMKESVLTKGQPLFAIGAGGAAVQQEDNQ